MRRNEFRKPEDVSWSKPYQKGPTLVLTELLHQTIRLIRNLLTLESGHSGSLEDKFVALHVYCCARGLCEGVLRSGASCDRKCAQQIQLNVIQGLWELFDFEEQLVSEPDPSISQSEKLFMALSKSIVT